MILFYFTMTLASRATLRWFERVPFPALVGPDTPITMTSLLNYFMF